MSMPFGPGRAVVFVGVAFATASARAQIGNVVIERDNKGVIVGSNMGDIYIRNEDVRSKCGNQGRSFQLADGGRIPKDAPRKATDTDEAIVKPIVRFGPFEPSVQQFELTINAAAEYFNSGSLRIQVVTHCEGESPREDFERVLGDRDGQSRALNNVSVALSLPRQKSCTVTIGYRVGDQPNLTWLSSFSAVLLPKCK